MKVGIDTFLCGHGRSGAGSFILSLVQNLPSNDDIQFELFGSEMDRFTYCDAGGPVSYAGIKIHDSERAEIRWHMLHLSKFALRQKYDIVLFPSANQIVPFTFFVPYIVVVQDIVSRGLNDNDALRRKFRKYTLRHADRLIAASNHIKKDLCALGASGEKIEVIHPGIDHTLFYPHTEFEGDTVIIQPFSIKRPFIIYASRLSSAEKHHVELIKAFSLFKKNTGLPHRLVLAGEAGAYSDAVRKEAAASEYGSDILITGYFPHEHLPELYSCADACIFPSTAEGVGLPVIEAMATGIVVACAKAGALPEFAGDCALYFDSDNCEEMADAIKTAVTDEKVREKLEKSGFEWTKRFSWDKTAEKTVSIMQSVNSQQP